MSAMQELLNLYHSVGRPVPGQEQAEHGPRDEGEFRQTVRAIARTLPDDQLSQVIKAYGAVPPNERTSLQQDLLKELGDELHSRTVPNPSPSPSPGN
ncbi:hypothetical protein G5V65_03405 [Rhodobacter sp. HX-7-19]|uniref:Uncharacterized protein n=1 Tax=Paragemmobacter kunshanensis TaxID=2583234 RepID=A0A6M1TQ43_9RHOB|nr:hypothetical protein [Rhodobacter kunshanensis]NGQ89930.1 hypothetical protein [Rhodobacter kunshanensis]